MLCHVSSFFHPVRSRQAHVGLQKVLTGHCDFNLLLVGWLCQLVTLHFAFHWNHWALNFLYPCISNVLVLDLRFLNSSWFVYDSCALWNVSLGHVCCIFPTTVLALNIMIVIWRWRWWQISQISAFLLELLDLSHCFHCLLELFVLNFPFCRLLIERFFLFHHRRFHGWTYRADFLFKGRLFGLFRFFTNFLMLSNSIRIECTSAFSARN